jgi:hypothetical protein
LVSTGKYTAASYQFCENKPLQLVNGNELLYLLDEQGVKAKIEFPQSWKDPTISRDRRGSLLCAHKPAYNWPGSFKSRHVPALLEAAPPV